MRFFLGQANELGIVSALPQTTFKELCETVLEHPIQLNITREKYKTLIKSDQSKAKSVSYITPAAFKNSPTSRKTENVVFCNLIAIDIDDHAQSEKILTQRFAGLQDFNFYAYKTASSTTGAMRIRIFVEAHEIPIDAYPRAVKTIANLLSLETVTKESLVPVQPMYLPTIFSGDTESPFVKACYDAAAFKMQDLLDDNLLPSTEKVETEIDKLKGNLDYLKEPLEGVTSDDVKDALTYIDPNGTYYEWIEIACSIKHQFDNNVGFELWDTWSSKSDKYPGQDDLIKKWKTFKSQPIDRLPITIRTLFKRAQDKGWQPKDFSARIYQGLIDWIRSPQRSPVHLMTEGLQRIVRISSMIGAIERNSLINTLKKQLTELKQPITAAQLKNQIGKLEYDLFKAREVPSWCKTLIYKTSNGGVFFDYIKGLEYSRQSINDMYDPIRISDDKYIQPVQYALREVNIPRVAGDVYDPARADKLIIDVEGVDYLNSYKKTYPLPDSKRKKEAHDIFMRHMENLIAEDEYRRIYIDFLAYIVQNPGKKIRWAPVLQGTQGCGKTFIAVCMKHVLGKRHVRKVEASTVLQGNFNSWCFGSQVIFIEEVYVNGPNKYTIMNKLKPLISDDEVNMRALFKDDRTVDNITNYLMFSNHHDALAVKDEDRRYFIVESAMQQPEHVHALGGKEYFNNIFKIENNPTGLRALFEEWTISPDFSAQGRAPLTKYFQQLVDQVSTPLSSAIMELIQDDELPLVKKDLISLRSLRNALDFKKVNAFSDNTLSIILREKGFKYYGRKSVNKEKHTLYTKGLRRDPVIVATERLDIL
jgi:hypothetical protein